MKIHRPRTLISATVLLMLLNLFHFSTLLIYPPNSPRLPGFIYYYSIFAGVVGLIAVVGLWTLKRWGWWLSTSIAALSILASAPYVVLYPHIGAGGGTGGKVTAGVVALCYVLVLVLVVLPATRKAVAAARASVAQA
jgi:hypothetical protein